MLSGNNFKGQRQKLVWPNPIATSPSALDTPQAKILVVSPAAALQASTPQSFGFYPVTGIQTGVDSGRQSSLQMLNLKNTSVRESPNIEA